MIRRILVPLDGSAVAEVALEAALLMVAAFDAEIVVQRVVEEHDDSRFLDGMHWRFLRAEALAYLNRIAAGCADRCKSCHVAVAEGVAAEQILQCSREREADLIVLSTHGRGRHTLFRLGNTAHQVVSAAPTSVMIIPVEDPESPRPAQPPPRNILVPLDGSQRAEWALCLARIIAEFHGATLHMVHVVAIPEMAYRFPRTEDEEALRQQVVERVRDAARDYLCDMEARFGGRRLKVQSHLRVSAQVAKTIQALVEAEGMDFLVGSAHGHGGEREWLYGGIAWSLIMRATVPVLFFQDLAYEAMRAQPSTEARDDGFVARAP